MRTRFAVQIFVLLILLSSACVAVSTVENVKPQITAAFQEKVVIINYFLENTATGAVFPVDLVSQRDDKTFVFVPSKSLSNGRYRFTLYASDLVGNSKSYVYLFDVFVPATRIFLIEPNSLGVANSTTFRVTVYTSKLSVCKYTGISVPSFDDVRLKLFDITGNASTGELVNDHTISAYSVEPDFPRRFYVVCKDDLGRENFANFLLYADVTPPTLRSVVFDPSPIVEYPPAGELSSLLKVTASEPVICKYTQAADAAYADMVAFEGFDINDFDAYHEYNDEMISFPGDVIKETFTFYVQCEDRARFTSARMTRPITIDLTEGLQIRVVTPPAFSRNTSVFLNITTNRRSYCVYKSAESGTGDPTSYTEPAARLSSSFENLSNTHHKNLGTRKEGSHTISIRCDVPEGVGLEPMTAESSYTYAIDTTPPSVPIVNATTPVCGNTLSANFFANDTQSGISQYRWAVGVAGNIFANGSTTEGSVSVSQYNNGSSFELAAGQAYIFSVSAVDGAGNEGRPGVSNQISFDETGIGCDTTPPSVTVEMSDMGDSATIVCSDDASGCTSIGSFYGTSYEQPCNTTQYYLDPVIIPLFRTTIVCWSIKDNAGNVNDGSQIVDLNASALGIIGAACEGGIDGDGDGYGERCLLGPDCDDTDPDMNVGCLNGCVQDLDGDGYGKGCSLGNDCNGRDPNKTTNCPNNCISDNDGDEFGLGCDNGPDCKGDDSRLTINCPNGCIDDNDGDSYGLGCPVGFDCHGEDHTLMRDCGTLCIQDTDGDTYGVGCTLGLDCNGRQPMFSVDCANGCVFDEDGDGYGFGCLKGLDCNGMNPFIFMDCPNNCVSDNDGDGYGWKCDNGHDCNDTDPYTNLDCSLTTDCMYDHDGDGFGLGCEAGPDCDDYDAMLVANCTENCTYDVDCNGLPDLWQEEFFNSTVCEDVALCGPNADPDGDGYSNIEEYRRDSNPLEKEAVVLPPERPSEAADDDGDGMSDACERMYGLNPSDPYDYDKDPDLDGLDNRYECTFREGMCVNWLNPMSADTDNDGYSDSKEIDAGTDPCDPDSRPSALFSWIILVLGILLELGSTAYLIYKKYYIPLVSPPPKPAAVPRAAAAAAAARPAGAPLPGVGHHIRPRHLPPRKPSGPLMSKELFDKEMQKRADERERILKVFGERKEMPKKPKKIMEEIARKPVEVRHVRVIKPSAVQRPAQKPAQPPSEDYVKKLSGVVGDDYFDKISGLTREEADYFGRLATISKEKEVQLEEDQVSKLASISRKVVEDKEKSVDLEKAFKKSGTDELDDFLSSRKRVDTFIKEYVPEAGEKKAGHAGGAEDSFDALSKIGEGKGGGVEALSELSKPKKEEVMAALEELGSTKAKEAALSKMETLSGLESKEELFKAFRQMSREKHVDKNVFEVLLSYLLKSGKITKHDVSEIIFGLESQGVLDKKDVSEVFFNLGIKK